MGDMMESQKGLQEQDVKVTKGSRRVWADLAEGQGQGYLCGKFCTPVRGHWAPGGREQREVLFGDRLKVRGVKLISKYHLEIALPTSSSAVLRLLKSALNVPST